MPTPSKPYTVLAGEKRSHRTKAEMQMRKAAEAATLSGVRIKESERVRTDKTAHKVFKRLIELLEKIEKNDAIYENVLNRYCVIFSECEALQERVNTQYEMIYEMQTAFHKFLNDSAMDDEKKGCLAMEFGKSMAKLSAQANVTDKALQTKRRMLLDIEKENIMTVAAALRSIPKKVKNKVNPLMEVMNG